MTPAERPGTAQRRREVAIAGHTGAVDVALVGLSDDDPGVRATALGALDRLGRLDPDALVRAVADPSAAVRRRAAAIAARHVDVDLGALLDDSDDHVVEMAAWAAGEHGSSRPEIVDRLVGLARDASDPLVRESAVAALGAIGDAGTIPTIVAAMYDKPAVRRRAVLALAPFVADGVALVDAALERALSDRDWQVRQAAEDLCRAVGREIDRDTGSGTERDSVENSDPTTQNDSDPTTQNDGDRNVGRSAEPGQSR